MKRFLLIALCMCLVFASGCTDNKPAGSDEYVFEGYKGSADAVMTINGEDVTVDEFNYFLIQATYDLKAANNVPDDKLDDFWSQTDISTGKTYEQIAIDTAIQKATEFHVYRTESIKKGIELSQYDKDNIYKQANYMKDTYGEEMNRLQLKSGGLTPESYSDLCEMGYYRELLFSNFVGNYPAVSDEKLLDFYEKNFIRAKHILAMTIDPETQAPLDQQGKDAAHIKISEAYSRILNGEDFDTVMAEYTEDPGYKEFPDGYTFTMADDYSQGFKDVALLLKEGEVSEIIETESGYHILKREPLLPMDVATNDEVVMEKLMSADFEAELVRLNDEAEIIVNKTVFEAVDPGKVLADYLASYDETMELIKQEFIKYDKEHAEE